MAVSDKTRKKLWGRSGGVCAICGRTLVEDIGADGGTVIGEECHIEAKRSKEARHNPALSTSLVDAYSNLILLCPIHHKVVDDNPDEFPVQRLRGMKRKHEAEVKRALAAHFSRKAAAELFEYADGRRAFDTARWVADTSPEARRRAFADTSLLSALSPREFEGFVASVFQRAGYEVKAGPRGRDAGFDFIATTKGAFGERVEVAVECKKESNDRPLGLERVTHFAQAILEPFPCTNARFEPTCEPKRPRRGSWPARWTSPRVVARPPRTHAGVPESLRGRRLSAQKSADPGSSGLDRATKCL